MKFLTVKDLTIRVDLISHIKINHAPARLKPGEIYLTHGEVILVDEATAREFQIAISKATA